MITSIVLSDGICWVEKISTDSTSCWHSKLLPPYCQSVTCPGCQLETTPQLFQILFHHIPPIQPATWQTKPNIRLENGVVVSVNYKWNRMFHPCLSWTIPGRISCDVETWLPAWWALWLSGQCPFWYQRTVSVLLSVLYFLEIKLTTVKPLI